MKRTGPGEKGDDVKADSNSDSTENLSSTSLTEELQGFTSASEIYSVRSTCTHSHLCYQVTLVSAARAAAIC